MDDYHQFSQTELIERLKTLESRTAEREKPGASNSTQEQIARAALADSEERLRAILETAVEGIITIDERGIVESMNRAAEKAFGYQASEVIGKNVSMLMPNPYRREHDGYLKNYREGGEAKIIGIGREVVAQRKDGSTFPMDLSVSEVRLAKSRLFTGFIRDITERKRAEEKLASLAQTLVEKNKELETIVYVASHDLRSPLVNIQGFSEELSQSCDQLRKLLRNELATKSKEEASHIVAVDVPEALGFIRAGVAKIDSLLAGLLRFSRLGRVALNIEPLKMRTMINDIVHAMEFQLKRAGARLEIGELPDCMGDSTQINQVFSNLLDNALKYLDPNRPGIISISGTLERGTVTYKVQDNGIGIAPQHQARVFEIFHRLNPSHSQGEGLGLTISQRIMERHGGKIWVESTPDVGTTFFVCLPAAISRMDA
jgi:PAS domain S-box-containing protein